MLSFRMLALTLANFSNFISVLMTVMPQGRDSTKSLYYATSSFTYLTAMITSNMALQHVNYPTQVSLHFLISDRIHEFLINNISHCRRLWASLVNPFLLCYWEY